MHSCSPTTLLIIWPLQKKHNFEVLALMEYSAVKLNYFWIPIHAIIFLTMFEEVSNTQRFTVLRNNLNIYRIWFTWED